MAVDFWKDKTVLITGSYGFLGGSLCRLIEKKDAKLLLPRSHTYDLRHEADISRMFNEIDKMGRGPIDILFNLAANVGGIGYNQSNAYSLFYENAIMGINLIHHSIANKVKKFVQVGTVCAYPKWTPAPFKEESLWKGYPEETNAPYGLAKKMLLVQLQAARDSYGFNGIYLLPTNLYGPRDDFNPARSHVIPALIKKCFEAKKLGLDYVTGWGTGRASRDFLYVEDAAEALILAAEKYDRPEPLNLGSGQEVAIAMLLLLVKEATEFKGRIEWDTSKPDGQPRRCLDSKNAKYALGWTSKTLLRDGLKKTVEWYLENLHESVYQGTGKITKIVERPDLVIS